MKKKLLFAVVFCASFAQAQVGINIDDPKSTLDVVGKPTDLTHFDGIIAPRITGNELAAKTYTTAQTGAMVYVTAASTSLTGQVINVAEPGYYYFDGTVWVRVSGTQAAFAPTLLVYTNTADPNSATEFDEIPYYSYDSATSVCTSPNPSWINDASLAGNSSYLYIGQTSCDVDGDGSEFSYWIFDGSQYVSYTAPASTEWYLSPTNTDAGSNKISSIHRSGSIGVGTSGVDTRKIYAYNSMDLNNYPSLYASYNLTRPTIPMSSSGAKYQVASYNSSRTNIAAGVTNSGYNMGSYIMALRNFAGAATDGGTPLNNYGLYLQSGHNNGTANPTTTNVYGIHYSPYNLSGTITNSYDIFISDYNGAGTVTNKYGLYINGLTKNNYFEGNVGIGTNAPDSNLHIQRTARANFKLQSTSNLSVFWQEAWGATGGGSVHRFVSGRGSKGSPALMQTEDKLGGIEFWGYTQRTGSAEGFAMGATIESYMAANAVSGADNLPSDLRFVTESATDSGERMRIDQNGNVGINVTGPTARLHIADIQAKKSIQIDKPSGVLGGAQILLNENRSSGTGGIKQKAIQLTNSATLAPQTEIAAQYDLNGLRYFYIDANQTNVGPNPEEAPDFMITKEGNVGIGATSMLEPAAKLDVRGAIKIGTNAATASVGMMRYDDTTGTFQGYKTCTAAKPCNGGVTTGTGWVDLH